jgi:hypothetical protein
MEKRMQTIIPRRQFIKIGLSGLALLVLPIGCGDLSEGVGTGVKKAGKAAEKGRFFNEHQYETIRALTGAIIPEDDQPGAITANVVDYLDYLLGAFTVDPPRIFAQGPYSGRHGGDANFAVYLPLARVQEISWRNYLEGSQGIAEREFNGPVIGLQTIFTEGVQVLDDGAQSEYGKPFNGLTRQEKTKVFRQTGQEFQDAIVLHSIEGMYGAPEYGGNAGLVGWKNIAYEGDRQPIGYNRQQVELPDPGGELTARQLSELIQWLQASLADVEGAI